MGIGARTAVDVGVRRFVDHEQLAGLGLDERTEAGRRHVVGDALEVARAAGVEVIIAGRDVGRHLEPSAIVVEQPPPERFRSNAAWAADLFRNVCREYAADPSEGANALEALCAGVAFRRLDESKLTGALGRAVRHVESGYGQPGEPAGLEGGASAAKDRLLRGLGEPPDRSLGDPASPYAAARAMLRAELEGSGSVMVDAIGERPVRLDPGPYGESLGGCIAWHLAETTSRFRCFNPDELARTCGAVVVAQGANELIGHAGLTCTLDAGVGFEFGNPDIRMEFERHGLAAGELSQLGTLVSGQVLRTTGHPDDPCRPRNNVGVPAVEPVGFRPLDSRWPEAVEPITDRVLSVCVRSGVALTLTDSDRVRVWQDGASGAREEPWPATRAYSSYARVRAPDPGALRDAGGLGALGSGSHGAGGGDSSASCESGPARRSDAHLFRRGEAASARDGGGAVRQRHGQTVRAVRCASRAGVGTRPTSCAGSGRTAVPRSRRCASSSASACRSRRRRSSAGACGARSSGWNRRYRRAAAACRRRPGTAWRPAIATTRWRCGCRGRARRLPSFGPWVRRMDGRVPGGRWGTAFGMNCAPGGRGTARRRTRCSRSTDRSRPSLRTDCSSGWGWRASGWISRFRGPGHGSRRSPSVCRRSPGSTWCSRSASARRRSWSSSVMKVGRLGGTDGAMCFILRGAIHGGISSDCVRRRWPSGRRVRRNCSGGQRCRRGARFGRGASGRGRAQRGAVRAGTVGNRPFGRGEPAPGDGGRALSTGTGMIWDRPGCAVVGAIDRGTLPFVTLVVLGAVAGFERGTWAGCRAARLSFA